MPSHYVEGDVDAMGGMVGRMVEDTEIQGATSGKSTLWSKNGNTTLFVVILFCLFFFNKKK